MAAPPMTAIIKLPTEIGEYEQPLGLFINNEFVPSVEGKTFEVINPTTEEVITSVHEATEADVDIAVRAARAAFEGPWSTTTPEQRSRLLHKLADLFERNLPLLSAVETLNNGKAHQMAMGDVANVAATLRYYAGWADKVHGKVIDTASDKFNYVRYEPLGVCGQIIPWNFPLGMLSWKIAPALATGNTVVLKSAEQTPLTALLVGKLIVEAGFPPGVVNIISGIGRVAGAAMSAHMDIDKVAFTGSTTVGREIMKAAAMSNLKKVTLELGGKSPNIVFEDADLDQAAFWANIGLFFNQGQVCCAGSRVFVQESIYDTFIEKFKAMLARNVVGDPFQQNTFQGPQISKTQFDRVMGFIDEGKSAGATLECGGERHGSTGYFIKPTIFGNCDTSMSIMQEEIFGPVVAVAKFKDIDEAVKLANDTRFGLASGVHTKSLKTAFEVSSRLKAGTVWVNTYNMVHYALPFGGFKESGIGRELGKAALASYTQAKTVHINLA